MRNNKKVGDYKIYCDQPIGSGATGLVVKGERISDGKIVAVKIIDKIQFQNKNQKEKELMYRCIQREISIHKSLNNEHFIKLYDYNESNSSIYMFLELGDCTIDEYVRKIQLTQINLKSIMKQVIEGFLHLSNLYITNKYQNNKQYKGICHLDVKPQNILMVGNIVKITDFGLSVPLNIGENSSEILTEEEIFMTKQFYLCQGTLKYMSPQQLSGEPIENLDLHDVWSAGVIFYEFVYNKHPYFKSQLDKHQLNAIQINQLTVDKMLKETDIQFPKSDKFSDSVVDLLKKMLSKDYRTRWNWKQCLNHPFILT